MSNFTCALKSQLNLPHTTKELNSEKREKTEKNIVLHCYMYMYMLLIFSMGRHAAWNKLTDWLKKIALRTKARQTYVAAGTSSGEERRRREDQTEAGDREQPSCNAAHLGANTSPAYRNISTAFYIVSQNNKTVNSCIWLPQMLTDFKNRFTSKWSDKLAMK